MRTLVIGDIHGGLKALKQVLERAKVSPEDQLIFLGDYVDGWSDSANAISYLISIKETYNCIFLRGNHDDLLAQWLKTSNTNERWEQHGGRSSIKAYEQFTQTEKAIHLQFLEEKLVNYHIDKHKRLFVHAGFTNMHGPEHEYETYMFYWDRTLWETALSMDKDLAINDLFYPKRLTHFSEIFIGHTPVTRIGKTIPIKAANVWNIDTGAAFKGALSILDVNNKTIFQSDPVYTLYPNESGRNS